MNEKQDQIGKKFNLLDGTLKEYSLILSVLINGQEGLKAELSEMRLQNGKYSNELS
jgi:hypothetical protein